MEGESRLCQKVCHPHHSPSVGPACNQQFTLKVFVTSLTRLPCCFSLWLNLLFLSSTSFSSPCLAARCLRGPQRHSIIPLTTPMLHSPRHSFPLSVFLISALPPHIVHTTATPAGSTVAAEPCADASNSPENYLLARWGEKTKQH